MTWHEPDGENIRVFRGGDHDTNTIYPSRTDAQKHTDEALNKADDEAATAAYAFLSSLSWARSIGVEIPARVRGVETILRQWQTHLADERKRRG